MGRPKKNRVGEHAAALGEALALQFQQSVAEALADAQAAALDELKRLRAEIRALSRRVDTLKRTTKQRKPKVGKWVPGGPGRPPKDASERVAAFAARAQGERKASARDTKVPKRSRSAKRRK